MAHGIEIVGGQGQMFSVKETPWHKLGTVLDKPPTVVEGIKAAGLNWNVQLKDLYLDDDTPVSSHQAVVKSKGNVILGLVGNSYTPLQNKEAFEWFQPFLDEGVAELESAGSLFDGKKVWVLAKIAEKPLEVVKGDTVEQFILLSNGHDGRHAVRVGYTPIRVVCNNTLTAAHDSEASKLIRIFHSSKVKRNTEAVREIMDASRQTFTATVEQYKLLAKKQISQEDLIKYVKLIYAHPSQRKNMSHEDEMDTENVRQSKVLTDITELFETGLGSDIKGVQGTYWGAYNAVSEYNQYLRGDSEERRLENLWFRSGKSNTNTFAFDLALKMAA